MRVNSALLPIVKLAPGPNRRNQRVVNTLGLLETTFRLRITLPRGVFYRSVERVLYAQLRQVLMALLEDRRDTAIWKVMRPGGASVAFLAGGNATA